MVRQVAVSCSALAASLLGMATPAAGWQMNWSPNAVTAPVQLLAEQAVVDSHAAALAAQGTLRGNRQLAADESRSSHAGGLLCAAAVGATVLAAGLRRQQKRGGAATQATRLQAARLHGSQQTRSPLVNWYCYEADIPLEMRDPRPSPHPFGQVPHLSDDGGVEVFESGAILLYLADKYGGNSTPEERAKYTKWVVWANSTLDGLCFGSGMSSTQIGAPGRDMDVLEELLGKSEWLVDGKFSVADVAVASYLNYVPIFFGGQDLSSRPNVASYMKRCAQRPGYVQAFGKQHADAILASVKG
eukprot:TRINITY_DN74800_c0_g1_i1.p1 TRINITY_DN74800_c0_g1~~TRINITY_DN74800_c0_g1_i1.p1  ORF type:complete len:301 (-),score=82.49 TRINITY_DN74800_c0_g1_i1:69-971(-)